MGKNEEASEEIIARLKLDVKALTLLYESDSDLRPVLEKSLLESHETYLTRFVALLQSKRPPEDGGSVPMALGEIVLASFLTVLGLAVLVPVMAGLTNPQQWVQYFSGAVTQSSSSGPLYLGVPLLDFAFSAMLLLGAFYTLRRASKNLKDAGLVRESGRT